MKQTEQPGINFDKFILEKANLVVNSDFSFPEGGVSVDFKTSFSQKLDNVKGCLKTILEVTVEFKDVANPPIEIDVSVAGYFSVKDLKNLKALEEFSAVNAPAFIFPFAREIIANLTLKSGFPPLLLPPGNIINLVGQSKVKSANKKSVKKKSAKKIKK